MLFAWLDLNRAVALAVGTVLAGGLFGAGIEVSSALSTAATTPVSSESSPLATEPAVTLVAVPRESEAVVPPARAHSATAPHGALAAAALPVPAVPVVDHDAVPSEPVPESASLASPVAAVATAAIAEPGTASVHPRATAPAGVQPSRTRSTAASPAKEKPPAAHGLAQTVVVGDWSVPTIVPPGRWQLTRPALSSGAPVQVDVSGCGEGCAFAAGELFIKAPAGRVTLTWSAPAVTGFSSWSTSITASWG